VVYVVSTIGRCANCGGITLGQVQVNRKHHAVKETVPRLVDADHMVQMRNKGRMEQAVVVKSTPSLLVLELQGSQQSPECQGRPETK
jgi:hypothetical protein